MPLTLPPLLALWEDSVKAVKFPTCSVPWTPHVQATLGTAGRRECGGQDSVALGWPRPGI